MLSGFDGYLFSATPTPMRVSELSFGGHANSIRALALENFEGVFRAVVGGSDARIVIRLSLDGGRP